MRYCIFGGSFDPPHEGHVRLAAAAREAAGLDTTIWVPSPAPPHKKKPDTPFHHRLAMARLAAARLPDQIVSGIEEGLPHPSYSLRTVQALKAAYDPGRVHSWYFLIGADNWAGFPSWHRPEEVLREIVLIAFPRRGYALDHLPPDAVRLDLPEFPAESSHIRAGLASHPHGGGDDLPIPPPVRAYIAAHGLYGAPQTDDAEAGHETGGRA